MRGMREREREREWAKKVNITTEHLLKSFTYYGTYVILEILKALDQYNGT